MTLTFATFEGEIVFLGKVSVLVFYLANHHFAPPFGTNMFGTFSKHLDQANLRRWEADVS